MLFPFTGDSAQAACESGAVGALCKALAAKPPSEAMGPLVESVALLVTDGVRIYFYHFLLLFLGSGLNGEEGEF